MMIASRITVRLAPKNFSGKSLTAIAVAAHEVGHALQSARKEQVFNLRSRYIPTAMRFKRMGIWILAAAPLLAIVIKSPVALLWIALASLGLQLIGALAYLIVLPEEWDASFNKALPILKAGQYIQPGDETAVRRVLRAAALTYVASSLASLLNLARWLAFLRRA